MIIPQIPFFGLDKEQIDSKWVSEGFGLEANIFNGDSFDNEFSHKFDETLSYAKSLNPSLLTLHFPTDNADYINSEKVKANLYKFIEAALKYEVKGITLHANQFLNVEDFQKYDLIDNRKKVTEFLADLDDNLKGTSLWVGIENLPIIGNCGDDFDPIFVYPKDFEELTKLNLRNIGITWDICHWSITFLTHLSISKLFRDKAILLNNYLEFMNIKEHIKHYHFSSFKQLTIPYSGVRCYEGQLPQNGSIDERLLKQACREINKSCIDKEIGVTFEVLETDYSNRKISWETLKWFGGVIDEGWTI